jgi:hypothetical protein
MKRRLLLTSLLLAAASFFVAVPGRAILVLKRAHVPILNVQYDPGGCGCYRDWAYQEVRFQADNVISPGYAEPTTPPLTVCDTGGAGGDIGSFTGVAAEKLADRLILTTQFEAGWYRYTMKWRFYLDGRIEPVFGFAAVNSSCIAFTHRHQAYWRFDFDIDTPGNAIVLEHARPTISHKDETLRPRRSCPRRPCASIARQV